jgi:hypothetical protein
MTSPREARAKCFSRRAWPRVIPDWVEQSAVSTRWMQSNIALRGKDLDVRLPRL